jgi:hemolysin activation/secretion protein
VVPAQEIENGKVEIRVVEGYVAHVIFKGSDDRPDILRATGERITDVRPVRVADLERYLLLLNDLPGATVTSVLQPAADQTGAADLVITIEQDTYQNFTTLDDRGTRYVGPVQYTLGTRINSPFGLGDQTFIRGITTPLYPNELMAYDFVNTQTLDEQGTTLALQLNFAQAHPGYSLSPFKLTSDASTIAFVLAHPFIRSRVQNLRLNVQAVANEYRTTADSPTGDGSVTSGGATLLRDSIRSLRVGVVYDLIDKYQGANLLGLQFSQGLPILGASHPGATFLSRASGRPDYNKLNFDVSRAQSLAEHWTLISALTAQKAFTSLLSSEQFGLGGSTFLRSYDPSDLIGDTGVGAKFELQFSDQPNEWYLKNYDLYSYFDIGKVQNRVVGLGDKPSDAGISIGLGSRFTLTDWSNGYLELSQPVMRGVPTEGIHDHHPRVFFALIAKF